MKKVALLFLVVLSIFQSCKKDDTEETILYQDELKTENLSWNCDSTTNHYRKFFNNSFNIHVDTLGVFYYSFAPIGTINYPYSLEVDATIQLDKPNLIGYVGFIFNFLDNNNYSIVNIYNSGTFFMWTRKNGINSEVIANTYNSIINAGSGKLNKIKINQSQNKIELIINSKSVGTANLIIPDKTFKVGILAGTVSLVNMYSPTTGIFNNILITKK